MTFFYRADSSFQIGTGHLIRGVALARQLKQRGHKCVFLSRHLPGDASHLVREAGFDIIQPNSNLNLKEEVLWISKNIVHAEHPILIFDNYLIDQELEQEFYRKVPVVVIDDLANRPHACDILIDYNYRKSGNSSYTSLVPDECVKFLGPQHCLLRDVFVKYDRTKIETQKDKTNNILVFFGGTDPSDEMTKFMNALDTKSPPQNCHFIFLLSKVHSSIEKLKTRTFPYSAEIVIQPENIAQIMAKSTYFIGSGGTITWERLYMGLPGAVIAVADNQVPASQSLAEDGYQRYHGQAPGVSYSQIISQAFADLNSRDWLKLLSKKGQDLVSTLDCDKLIQQLNTFTKISGSPR